MSDNTLSQSVTVKIKSFAFMNPHGGTAMSDSSHNAKFPGKTTTVKATNGWEDYETGFRFIGESADPELTAYLKEHGSKEDTRIFFGEFDVVDQSDVQRLTKEVQDIEPAFENNCES